MNKHVSPGLVVMGVDLLSRGHEFESQHGIFQLIRCYNCVPTVVWQSSYGSILLAAPTCFI